MRKRILDQDVTSQKDPLDLDDWVTSLSFKKMCFEDGPIRASAASEAEPTPSSLPSTTHSTTSTTHSTTSTTHSTTSTMHSTTSTTEEKVSYTLRQKAHKRKAIDRALGELITFHAVLLKAVQSTNDLVAKINPEAEITQRDELEFLLALDSEKTMMLANQELIERKILRLFESSARRFPADYYG
jgi:hypothetical protein